MQIMDELYPLNREITKLRLKVQALEEKLDSGQMIIK